MSPLFETWDFVFTGQLLIYRPALNTPLVIPSTAGAPATPRRATCFSKSEGVDFGLELELQGCPTLVAALFAGTGWGS